MGEIEPTDEQQKSWAFAAAQGDRNAAQSLLSSIQEPVYRLALRMLGHPADAEDATQEILLVVLTHVGTFRGESALLTWVFRVAASHLLRFRRGRREVIDFQTLGDRLDAGLAQQTNPASDPEFETLTLEIRLRCTEAMLLSLDRNSRLVFILGEILQLSGELAAQVLDLDPAVYRKRLSRARQQLLSFMRTRCGVFDSQNPCRCSLQVSPAIANGILDPTDLPLARHPVREGTPRLQRSVAEVSELMRVALVMRAHPDYSTPEGVQKRLRELLSAGKLELLND
jgi:RNA polymerase sigma factor (sigma-70 family)